MVLSTAKHRKGCLELNLIPSLSFAWSGYLVAGVRWAQKWEAGSGGTSVGSCWKPPCPAEPIPEGSEDGQAAGQSWADLR